MLLKWSFMRCLLVPVVGLAVAGALVNSAGDARAALVVDPTVLINAVDWQAHVHEGNSSGFPSGWHAGGSPVQAMSAITGIGAKHFSVDLSGDSDFQDSRRKNGSSTSTGGFGNITGTGGA